MATRQRTQRRRWREFHSRIRPAEAVINVRTNHMVSEHPVEVIMRQGTINANRLEVTNSGEVIRFEGGVTMVLVPENDRSGEKSASR